MIRLHLSERGKPFCALEIPVRDAMPRCIRVLLHVASDRSRTDIAHVYLGPAAALRPDLAESAPAGAR